MKKFIIFTLIFAGFINNSTQALHNTYIYLVNKSNLKNSIWAYLPYTTGAFTSTADVPKDISFASDNWGTDHATASGSKSIQGRGAGSKFYGVVLISGNYDVNLYKIRVRIKTDAGDEVSFTSFKEYGDSLYGTSSDPVIFPGQWVQGTPATDANGFVQNASPGLYGKAIGTKVFNGTTYTLLSHFEYNPSDTDSNYTTTDWGTNWQKLLVDIAFPAQQPIPPVPYSDFQKEMMNDMSNPNILQAGSFATIINKIPTTYQIQNSTGTGAKVELAGNGDTTNVAIQVGADNYFNKLWITPPANGNPADKSSNPYVILEPKNESDRANFPTFYFVFDENKTNPRITIYRNAVGTTSTEDSWLVNLNPIINGLTSIVDNYNVQLPLPGKWSLNITIDENWNIIINTWNLTSSTVYIAGDGSTYFTNHIFTFTAQETTYSTSFNNSQPVLQDTPVSIQGGLCGLQILNPQDNPTCVSN